MTLAMFVFLSLWCLSARPIHWQVVHASIMYKIATPFTHCRSQPCSSQLISWVKAKLFNQLHKSAHGYKVFCYRPAAQSQMIVLVPMLIPASPQRTFGVNFRKGTDLRVMIFLASMIFLQQQSVHVVYCGAKCYVIVRKHWHCDH